MKMYRRRRGSDCWHDQPKCRWWPKKDYVAVKVRTHHGELCDRCKTLARKG